MLITLTTDFSDSGGFVAQIKIILTRELPGANIIDVTHNITPFYPMEAAYILLSITRIAPRGSIHLVVVDPGVGTDRRILAMEYSGQFIVSPDNEALSLIQPERTFSINRRILCPEGSSTFEARDVMAKAISMIVKKGIESVGTLSTPPSFNIATPEAKEDEIRGKIIHIDRFGNCISNISKEHIKGFSSVEVGNIKIINLSRHYCCGDEPKALINSNGFLEFALFRGNFSKKYRVSYLDPVLVTLNR